MNGQEVESIDTYWGYIKPDNDGTVTIPGDGSEQDARFEAAIHDAEVVVCTVYNTAWATAPDRLDDSVRYENE